MTDHLTVTRRTAATLTREMWTFSPVAAGPRLDAYDRREYRPRAPDADAHGYALAMTWRRGAGTGSPPLPADVRDEVRRRFCEAVTVVSP